MNGSPSSTPSNQQSQYQSQQKEQEMTLAQARKRYPLVPDEIIRWALQNIADPRDVDRGLLRLEQAKRIQVRYGV